MDRKGLDTFPTMGCKVIPVIQACVVRGTGEHDDPVRVVEQFYDCDSGELLAENDPIISVSYVRPAHRRSEDPVQSLRVTEERLKEIISQETYIEADRAEAAHSKPLP